MINKTISHYRVLEKLGKGGMGVVYIAEDTKLKRQVALKFLPPEFTRDKDAKDRFFIEAQAAAALDHQNICPIYEIQEAEDQIFIAMSYIKGKNLKEKLTSNPLPLTNAINIAIQIAEGLQEAHEKEIVHRDIKSANIMITEKGQVKIMDFGLAKLKGESKLTKTGTTVGTAAYMSPEQSTGKEVDHRTDIWSLGVILYEMLTGKLPFKGEYEQAIMYAIMNDEPEPLTGLRTGVPQELERIINKALAKEQTERYQTTTDLLVDLKTINKTMTSKKPLKDSMDKKSKPSIAVLSFTDMSPQKDQEYFCEGMAEELINALTKVARLQVASRTSAFQFKEKGYDISEIGKKLNVQSVLEGSIRKAGNKLRITAQLVNVSDGYHLWSEKYDRDMDDIFAIQDEISLSIVDNLKVKLLRDEKTSLAKHHTENKEAYNLYLKGRYFWNRRSEVGFGKAFEFFQRAIEIDPFYALPYIGIADTYNISGHFCFVPPDEAFKKARSAATKALEIDKNLSEAHTSLAWIYTYYDRNWILAEKEYKLSIELNPEYATAHEWYAIFLAGTGRIDEAFTEIKEALELDPLSTMINAIFGCIFIFSRKFEEAIEQFRKTLEINPDFPFAYIWQGVAFCWIGANDKALVSLLKSEALAKDMTYGLGFLGMAYARAGQNTKALKVLEKMEKLSENKYVSPMYKALIFIGLGNKDKAFTYIDKAFIERDPFLFYIKELPMFDSLRSDPRFIELLKKMGFKK